MAVKMKNALVGSVGLFAIAMAFALLAIPQVSYADQAVDESDALAAADEARYSWVRDESGNWLYCDAQSNLYVGWLKYGGAWYWLNPETGVMAVGVVEIGGMGYHFAQSGALTYGWEFDNGSWYCSNGSGVLVNGWYSYNGGWYYFQEGTYAMYEGMIDFGGQLYWLKPSASGRMAVGWELIDGDWYHFNGSGCADSAWLEDGGDWYYFDPMTHVMATGWLQLGSDWYYLSDSGVMQTGWQFISGAWYYFDGSGIMAAGDWCRIGGTWYYFHDWGGMATGWLQLGNDWYWLRDSGAMETGWAQIGGAWYHFANSGLMSSNGWEKIGGSWYYFRSWGGMVSSEWINLGTEGDDQWYYLKSSGAMQTGWWHNSGHYYYFGSNGLMLSDSTSPSYLAGENNRLSDMRSRGWYVSPLLADEKNTREERIEAMISTAYEYLGDTYKACYSQAPGGYVDCSGLAMQGLYAAGFDPWPVSPERHSNPAYEYESRNMWNLPIQRVSYSDRQRGDLIYYDNGYGTIIHVAIYLGDDRVIEAWPPSVTVMSTVNSIHPHVYGVQRPFA